MRRKRYSISTGDEHPLAMSCVTMLDFPSSDFMHGTLRTSPVLRTSQALVSIRRSRAISVRDAVGTHVTRGNSTPASMCSKRAYIHADKYKRGHKNKSEYALVHMSSELRKAWQCRFLNQLCREGGDKNGCHILGTVSLLIRLFITGCNSLNFVTGRCSECDRVFWRSFFPVSAISGICISKDK